MTDVKVVPGGLPVPSPTLVQTDQITILGDGSHARPLVAVGAGGLGVNVEDEGVPVPNNPHGTLNFVGAGVTAADAGGGVATVTIPGGISGITVEDEGAPIANNPHTTVNFVGAGVTASDVAGVATVSVPGGITVEDEGVGIANNPHGTVNFVGAGVTATDAGGGVATVTIPGGAALSSASPQTISDATNSAGVATDASRSDHVHAHGNRGGGTLHALFTSATPSPGFMQMQVVNPSPARALDTVFQPNAARPTMVIYSVDIECSVNGGVGAAGAIQLLSDAANPPTTIRAEVFLETGGNVAVTDTVTNDVESLLVYVVPEGHFVSLTTVSVAGGPIFGFDFATEITF